MVAAAGNYSTSRRFYPAAFATKTPPGGLPLISVGALNPNGSKAIFSDGGHWITAWASGAAVVSTLPVDINASRSPELRLRAHPDNPMPPGISLPASRESLDPDDYSGAFAVWSGTSFSAPLLAARITRALMEGARRDGLKPDALRGPGHAEPGAVRPEEHELAGLTGWTTPSPSRYGRDKPGRAARMADLLSAARAGSEDALGQIVNELSPLLWQVARSAGLSQGDAEDVLQTVWMRLITHLDGIHDAGALTGWLVTTTKREAWRVRAAGRKQLPADQDVFADLPDKGPGSEEQVILEDQRRELWAAIGMLSRRCQELLRIMAFAPRPDYATVAAALGMRVGSIGPTRGRCLAKLRALLADGPDGSLA